MGPRRIGSGRTRVVPKTGVEPAFAHTLGVATFLPKCDRPEDDIHCGGLGRVLDSAYEGTGRVAMARREAPLRAAFTLIELIVVIVIIGILAAMAIPRMSRGTAGATQTVLIGDLAVLRNAIRTFAEEHQGRFPPGPDSTDVEKQLTQFSDEAGTSTSAVKDASHRLGPYLARIPRCPVVTGASRDRIRIATASPPNVSGPQGWAYNVNTGEFIANSTDTDGDGTAYNTY